METIHQEVKAKIIKEFREKADAREGDEQIMSKKENAKKNFKPAWSKLNDEQIKEIKARSGEPLKKLSQEYGVSVSSICYHQKKGIKETTQSQKNDKPVSQFHKKTKKAGVYITLADIPGEEFRLQSLVVHTKVKYLTGEFFENLRKDLHKALENYA